MQKFISVYLQFIRNQLFRYFSKQYNLLHYCVTINRIVIQIRHVQIPGIKTHTRDCLFSDLFYFVH